MMMEVGNYVLSSIVICFLCFHSVVGISFVYGPNDVTMAVGETVTLGCRVNNKQSFKVFWRSATRSMYLTADTIFYPDAVNSRYSIIGNHAIGEYFLQIRDVQLDDAGHFQCIVIPNGSVVSRSARITLFQAPSPNSPLCSMSPLQGHVNVGQDITILCSSFGAAVPHVQLTWFEGNNVIADTSTLDVLSRTFTLEKRHNGQNFTCRLQHPAYPNDKFCTIVPLSIPPESRIEPSLVHGIVGDEAKFTCIGIDLSEHLEYTWFYQNYPVDVHNPRFEFFRDGRIFVIKNLDMEDNESMVRCRVMNRNGLFGSSMATIRVIKFAKQPRVTNMPSTIMLATTYVESATTFELQTPQSGDRESFKPGSLTIIIIILSIILGQFLVIVIIYIIYRVANKMKTSHGKKSTIEEVQLTDISPSVVHPRIINDFENRYKSLHQYATPPNPNANSYIEQSKPPSTSEKNEIDLYDYSTSFDIGEYHRTQSFSLGGYEIPNAEPPGYVDMRSHVTNQGLDLV